MNWRIKLMLWGFFVGMLCRIFGFTLLQRETWFVMFVSGMIAAWAIHPERVREEEAKKK